MWFLVLWGVGIAASILQFWLVGLPENIGDSTRVLLHHQFVVTFGLLGLLGFIESIIFGDKISKMINWPGGPYQAKYGFFQLCIGVVGVMTIWFEGSFWIAALVNMYVFGLAGFWTHISEMVKYQKLDLGHVINIIINALYQLFITILFILHTQ